ncbi:MAG: hypothetical protein ACT6QZ_13060, partial [Methylophilus sp.]|uniref:hypothetical protein n=1 Tax=Methylophilus sp. TaxID=29541 RepID=UPI0040373E17
VPFLLVTYSLGKQRKVTRRGAKNNGKTEQKPSKEIPTRTLIDSAVLALYRNKAMHVPCLDSPLQGALASA